MSLTALWLMLEAKASRLHSVLMTTVKHSCSSDGHEPARRKRLTRARWKVQVIIYRLDINRLIKWWLAPIYFHVTTETVRWGGGSAESQISWAQGGDQDTNTAWVRTRVLHTADVSLNFFVPRLTAGIKTLSLRRKFTHDNLDQRLVWRWILRCINVRY